MRTKGKSHPNIFWSHYLLMSEAPVIFASCAFCVDALSEPSHPIRALETLSDGLEGAICVPVAGILVSVPRGLVGKLLTLKSWDRRTGWEP